jgi:hypothetical protein
LFGSLFLRFNPDGSQTQPPTRCYALAKLATNWSQVYGRRHSGSPAPAPALRVATPPSVETGESRRGPSLSLSLSLSPPPSPSRSPSPPAPWRGVCCCAAGADVREAFGPGRRGDLRRRHTGGRGRWTVGVRASRTARCCWRPGGAVVPAPRLLLTRGSASGRGPSGWRTAAASGASGNEGRAPARARAGVDGAVMALLSQRHPAATAAAKPSGHRRLGTRTGLRAPPGSDVGGVQHGGQRVARGVCVLALLEAAAGVCLQRQ